MWTVSPSALPGKIMDVYSIAQIGEYSKKGKGAHWGQGSGTLVLENGPMPPMGNAVIAEVGHARS